MELERPYLALRWSTEEKVASINLRVKGGKVKRESEQGIVPMKVRTT